MANFIDETKPSVATLTNDTKILSSFLTENKGGSSWLYNEADITYEMPILFYNTYNIQLSVVNEIKI